MSKYFPTQEEALDAFEAERALPAFDGAHALAPWEFARQAIEREFDGMVAIRQKRTWCLRASERTSKHMRERHIHGSLVVPVRPRPGTKPHTEQWLLKRTRMRVREAPARTSWVAMTRLWIEVAGDDYFGAKEPDNWQRHQGTFALAIARLKLAHEDAKFWDLVDGAFASAAALLVGGALYERGSLGR